MSKQSPWQLSIRRNIALEYEYDNILFGLPRHFIARKNRRFLYESNFVDEFSVEFKV